LAEITSLREAISELVRDGSVIALEGFTHLIPFAAGHEIIRQRKRNLTLVRMTPDLIYDQMIGMGCSDKLVFSWAGNPGVGSLHRFRDAIENGWPAPLQIEEHSHADMASQWIYPKFEWTGQARYTPICTMLPNSEPILGCLSARTG
jgi:glutaconate CoA-transferase subunit A